MSTNESDPELGEWVEWCENFVERYMESQEIPKKKPEVVQKGRKAA